MFGLLSCDCTQPCSVNLKIHEQVAIQLSCYLPCPAVDKRLLHFNLEKNNVLQRGKRFVVSSEIVASEKHRYFYFTFFYVDASTWPSDNHVLLNVCGEGTVSRHLNPFICKAHMEMNFLLHAAMPHLL